MSSRNYETQILDSIQMIVDNAISKANFDKTIKAVVLEISDAATGKYTVSYQGNSMVVYSSNPETRYLKGTEVYVLIPGNDSSQKKTIIGSVENLGLDYLSFAEGEAGYEVNGTNMISSDKIFELCSYNGETKKVLYDRDYNINLINFDAQSFDMYTRDNNYLICGARFQTNLPDEQQGQGKYGIVFEIDYKNENTALTKTYIIDTDNMIGTPYNLGSATRQFEIFPIEWDNLVSVKQIYIFAQGFPHQLENQDNDIFVSCIEMNAANKIKEEDLTSTTLSFVTKQGTYFTDKHLDTDSLTIEAQIKIKGSILGQEAKVDYYWFKENNQITPFHRLYNKLGGAGWECLNSYHEDEQKVEWVPATYTFSTTKGQNTAKENKYKCIAIYNQNITLQKEFTITNLTSEYNITIASDEGTYFYYDNGRPTLTCLINDIEEVGSNYQYIWTKIDNNNRFSLLTETEEINVIYNNAVHNKQQLLDEIAAENKLTGQSQAQLKEYNDIIEQYENKTRIEKNKIYNINLKEITHFATYKCLVLKNEQEIGVASITITNDITTNLSYNLVINNGNQIFKYNEAGVAPNSSSAIDPISILPLTFTLYDKDGKEVDTSSIDINKIFWRVPMQHTMLEIDDVYDLYQEDSNFKEFYKTLDFNFNIHPTYIPTHINNTIQLVIEYKGNIITASTNFTFIKTGEIGTNGTEYICKLAPNTVTDEITPVYPAVTYNEETQLYNLNYRTEDNKWFKINFWKNGELIYSGTESGYTSEGQEINLQWSVLSNNYGKDIRDDSNFSIDSNDGSITVNPELYEHPANIIKCRILYNNVEYFALMPIIFVRVANDKYSISLLDKSGFQNVMYTANGTYPVYNETNPFELQVLENIDNIWEDISILEHDFSVNYDWSVKGQVYYSYWQSESNLKEKIRLVTTENRNQKYFEPVDTFNGLCVTNAIECKISREDIEIGTIHIPVHLYLNRYGNSAINGWDGNSVSIDENNSGMILAPQVGAGKKNADNSFTGIFMGSVKEQGAPTEEHGLFGYNAGQRTIALNAEDGSARFGATGKGQIVIDPSTGNALIESGNFNTEAGTGMRIDLSEPSIEFGSGNFKVDKHGRLTAAGFSTIDYVDKKKDEIIQEVEGMLEQSPLKVELSTENLFIPCNENNVPINEATYNIDFSGTIDGAPIEAGQLEVLYDGKDRDNIAGFPVETDYNIDISLTNNNKVQQLHFSVKNEGVLNEIQIPSNSTYRFNFTYLKDENTSYTITKIITITVLPPGAPGKSAYDIWLDNGNEGTEQDYLDSLKGKDASAIAIEPESRFTIAGTALLSNSGNHELPLLEIQGEENRETIHSKNLIRAFYEPYNSKFWDENRRPSSDGYEILEDGWARFTLTNTGNTIMSKEIALDSDYFDWELDTDYTYVVELRNIVSPLLDATGNYLPIIPLGSVTASVFTSGFSLTREQLKQGGIYSKVVHTKNTTTLAALLSFFLYATTASPTIVEMRLSLIKGVVEIDDTFVYEECKYISPSLDNPLPFKPVGYQNMFNEEDWFTSCQSIAPNSISKEKIVDEDFYKIKASGLTTFEFMKNRFKENTSYSLSLLGRQESGTSSTLSFCFVYTDGTESTLSIAASTATTRTMLRSTENKTISYIKVKAASANIDKYVFVKDIMLIEGRRRYEYVPFGKYGVQLITNSKNLINIDTLMPHTQVYGETGEIYSYEGSPNVTSPLIPIGNIKKIYTENALQQICYYDSDYKYLGAGEKLGKTSSSVGRSGNINHTVPWNLSSDIAYFRIIYWTNGTGLNRSNDLYIAQKNGTYNSTNFAITAEADGVGNSLLNNIVKDQYLNYYSFVLDQPLCRVHDIYTPYYYNSRDSIIIEDGIAQLKWKTNYKKFDGTETGWTVYYETENYITFSHSNIATSTDCVHTSHFEPGYKAWSALQDVETEGFFMKYDSGSYTIGLQIKKSRLTEPTIEGFKQWLQETPFELLSRKSSTVSRLIDGKFYFLNTQKSITYLIPSEINSAPVLNGTYYTLFKGETGDSVICKITPSSQMFKSVDGPNGPFTPNEIYLFPEIFNTYFKSWYYSTDSINWEPVVSGEHGLEIGTFSEKANTLKISNTCDLYTEEDTTVSFKCETSHDSVYDVTTIAKSYDLVDLTVGGRNFMLKSHIFDDKREWGLESVLKTDDEGNPVKVNGQEVRWYLTEVKENGVVILDGTPAEGISAVMQEESTGEQYVEITANKNNKGRIHWIHSNTAETYLEDGDQFVFSCEIWTPGGIVNNVPPLFHYHSSVGYLPMSGEVTTEKSRIVCSGVWKEVEGYNTDFRFDFTGLEGTYCLTKFKLEKGKNPTDWTLAPEDLETIADLEYCIGDSKEVPPAADNPAWGAQTLYKPNLEDGDYLWSRVKNTATSGLITYTSYSCVLTYQKELISQKTEYLLCNIGDEHRILEQQNNPEWTTVKPTEFKIENSQVVASKLWSRQHLIYKTYLDGIIQEVDMYTNYTLDTAWEKSLFVETELTTKVNQIILNTNEGFVRIQDGNIVIGDSNKDPQHLIVMNHYGISFIDRGAGAKDWPTKEEIEQATEKTTAWTIDGSLDMNFIRTEELEATYIKNENLILGNKDGRFINDKFETVDAGDLDIYDKDGHLIFETVTSKSTGASETAFWIEGFKIHQYEVSEDWNSWKSTGYIYLSSASGFGEFDAQKKIIYGNQGGVWFSRVSETEKHIIAATENEEKYGIQMIPMSFTEDGITHRGLAFIRVDAK